ncbi:MAG TPA: type II toxin-antitoxin system HicA family toxin [Candidatus Thermoplasmatota archaeon]|nr:type II toxin-antitoxin system HicA family toxin [Candidatus Thermoplasmatota archaeon]
MSALRKAGFVEVGRKGSHVRLKRAVGGEVRIVVVPNHPEIARGTLQSILRQAGMTREELLKLVG